MRLRSVLLTAAASLFVLGNSAHATITYGFLIDPGATQLSFGQTTSLDVYLVEVVTGGDTSQIAADGGIGNAQVTLASQNNSLASIGTITPNAANPGSSTVFDSTASGVFAGGNVSLTSSGSQGVTGTSLDGGITRVLLASFNVTAGNTLGSTQITASDDTGSLGTDTFNFTFSLDNSLQAGGATINIVPEPATLILALAGMVMVLHRRSTKPRQV